MNIAFTVSSFFLIHFLSNIFGDYVIEFYNIGLQQRHNTVPDNSLHLGFGLNELYPCNVLIFIIIPWQPEYTQNQYLNCLPDPGGRVERHLY